MKFKNKLYKSGMMLIISFLFFINTFKAQSYQPFPDSNAVWTIGVYTVFGDFLYNYTYQYPATNIDTLIGSSIYKKINMIDIPGNIYYKGAIRQDASRKVFFMQKDSITERLLYDFAANTYDTVYNVYSDFTSSEPAHNEEILNVDSVLIGGVYHRRLLLKLGFRWIEGIGCTGGLFESTYGGTFSTVYKLDCFVKNGVSLYSSSTGHCMAGIEEPDLKDDIHFFPNPGRGIFTVTNKNINEEFILSISDLLGRSVFAKKIQEEEQVIDLTDFNDGVYFYTVKTKKGSSSGKLIIAK